MAFAIDQTGTKATFPERAGAAMTPIERREVALIEHSYRVGEVARIRADAGSERLIGRFRYGQLQ